MLSSTDWSALSGVAWFNRVEFLLDEVSSKAEARTTFLRGRVVELQANLDAVTDENRRLRERVTELELVTVAGVAERVTHLESKSAGSTSAGSQPASAAAEQQPAPAAAVEQPPPPPPTGPMPAGEVEQPPPPPPTGPAPAAAVEQPPPPLMQMVPVRAHPDV